MVAVKLYLTPDITYYGWLMGLWTWAEMTSGFLVACLPVTPKFAQSLSQTKLLSRTSSLLKSFRSRSNTSSAGEASNTTNLSAGISSDSRNRSGRKGQYQTLDDEHLLESPSKENPMTGHTKLQPSRDSYAMQSFNSIEATDVQEFPKPN